MLPGNAKHGIGSRRIGAVSHHGLGKGLVEEAQEHRLGGKREACGTGRSSARTLLFEAWRCQHPSVQAVLVSPLLRLVLPEAKVLWWLRLWYQDDPCWVLVFPPSKF